ncbi:hypothetical protein KR767_04230 [Luteibacter anthropi]|uniref:hypothetical protein n=1 Tax=Luteibacter anthropi TaxID=564369 RepID=UPI002032D788|nr:hypothetical protein [Luteibacter anthropi]URX63285.1 hypothetical protein KR767_04230 [Luteibacter anthropi]
MPRYPDAYLNHWSDIYVMQEVSHHGITLEQFLVHPQQILNRIGRVNAARYTEVEPVQHRCDRRAVAALRMRGEQLVEKFWRGPRHGSRGNIPRPHRR